MQRKADIFREASERRFADHSVFLNCGSWHSSCPLRGVRAVCVFSLLADAYYQVMRIDSLSKASAAVLLLLCCVLATSLTAVAGARDLLAAPVG